MNSIVSWDTEDNTPSPLYGCTTQQKCALRFAVDGTVPNTYIHFPEISQSKTLGELGRNFIARGFLNKEYRSLDYANTPKCFSFGYLAGSGSLGYVPLNGGMRCTPPVVTPTVCDIREPQLELRHGALRADAVNGNSVSTPLTVACSIDLKVRIMSSDRDGAIYFNAGKQFRSDLTINGVNLGEGALVTSNQAGAGLTLTSTLNGYDSSIGIGTFQGSKTIIVSLP